MAVMKPLDMLKTPRECGLKLLEEASEACEEMKLLERRPTALGAPRSMSFATCSSACATACTRWA